MCAREFNWARAYIAGGGGHLWGNKPRSARRFARNGPNQEPKSWAETVSLKQFSCTVSAILGTDATKRRTSEFFTHKLRDTYMPLTVSRKRLAVSD